MTDDVETWLYQHPDGCWTELRAGVWLPGVYQDKGTAKAASILDSTTLQRVWLEVLAAGEDRITADALETCQK